MLVSPYVDEAVAEHASPDQSSGALCQTLLDALQPRRGTAPASLRVEHALGRVCAW